MLNTAIIFVAVSFLGYAIGRWADNYLNFWMGDPDWAPDHWVYGFVLMYAGIVVFDGYIELYLFAFGLGHFMSDLNDFMRLKFFGKDNKRRNKVAFWHID